MTAYRMWTLTCDGCGEIHDSGQSFTKRDAERTAKREGWSKPATNEHLCHECTQDALTERTTA